MLTEAVDTAIDKVERGSELDAWSGLRCVKMLGHAYHVAAVEGPVQGGGVSGERLGPCIGQLTYPGFDTASLWRFTALLEGKRS